MKNRLHLLTIAVAITLANGAHAQFQNFTPVASSLPPLPANSPGEAAPFVFGNPAWTQTSVADRTTELSQGEFNSGAWDMIDTNRSGVDAGRYLFTVFETSQAGVMRYDRQTQTATTLWNAPAAAPALNSAVAFDASRWTPHGTYLTAEESWGTQPQPFGRLFELTNPTTATTGTGTLLHRNAVARVSHEGLVFDAAKNMYYIDEFNGGSIYKFTSADPNNSGAGYFSGGVNSVLRVGTGFVDNATGASTWVPFTDATGAALPGATTIVDPNSISSVDGRATTDLAAFKGTNYQRPEDLEIKTLFNGHEAIFVATTTTNEVYSLDITTGVMNVFVNRNTIDLSTGIAVGSALTSPDNLAVDSLGNIYIIEDQPGGAANIWLANDANNDGIAESVANWATMLTAGAEPTGLYFDIFNADLAYVNVQHPTSGNDRLIEINAVPEPGSLTMLALGLFGIAARRRRSAR